jgi:DNA polymerase-3 subunit epsilon
MDKNINKELPNSGKHTLLNSIKIESYVVISTETTGMNPEKDVILSIGAFVVDDSIL